MPVPIPIDWLASASGCGPPHAGIHQIRGAPEERIPSWYLPQCGRSGVEKGEKMIVGDAVARRRGAKAQSAGVFWMQIVITTDLSLRDEKLRSLPTKSYGI